ncbi:MAG: condensation domain-containing protein, partial [Psychrosphaera sp.]|nr:condensation domain-containing protein [Psychrosphaera sp.]
ELTDAYFVANPFSAGTNSTGEKLYKTGDSVKYQADGNLVYLGRLDQQVKMRGFRIELGEVEHQMSHLDEVNNVAVCLKEDQAGRQHLVAYYTTDVDLAPNQLAAIIQTKLLNALPEYMIPSQFVLMDALPLSRNGKIDRKVLPEPNYQSLENYVAPTDETQTQLCAIFEQVVDAERVGINDNFFSLGGDSIVAIRVVSSINQLGHEVSLKDLFKYPTPQLLAGAIGSGLTGDDQPILTVKPFAMLTQSQVASIDAKRFEDGYPLTLLQQGMVHINDADAHNVQYRDQVNIRMLQPWDKDSFGQAVQSMVDQHEILRTTFATVQNEQLQLVLSGFDFEQVEVDLTDSFAQDEQAGEEKLTALVDADRKRDFTPDQPLWRLAAYRLKDNLTVISFTCHHAILDGWSIASFLRALAASYESLLGAERLPLVTSTPLKFNAYVANEMAAMNSSASKLFWQDQLKECEIPWWTGARQAQLRVSQHPLSELEGMLDTLAVSMGVPMNVLLLTAHMKLMAMLNGTDAVTSSVVSNGRMSAEGGDSTLGLFLNTAPVHLQTVDKTWRELIEETQAFSLARQSHQYYPLAEIQRV